MPALASSAAHAASEQGTGWPAIVPITPSLHK